MAIENLIVYTNRPGASTPKELQHALDCRRITHALSRGVRAVPDRTVILNWGGARVPDWVRGGARVRYLNHPEAVRRKTTKVGQIRRFVEAGIPTLEVTTDFGTAAGWASGGARVLTRLDGQFGGRGIGIAASIEDLTALRDSVEGVDFYSKYFPKTHEYRVHVFNPLRVPVGGPGGTVVPPPRGEEVEQGGVIDIAQKKKRRESEVPDEGPRTVHQRVVRSHDNGWIFAHNDLHLPDDTRSAIYDAAVRAVATLGLDFGAVDVLVRHSKRDPNRLRRIAVAEVNTAPGIENTATLRAYVDAIQRWRAAQTA